MKNQRKNRQTPHKTSHTDTRQHKRKKKKRGEGRQPQEVESWGGWKTKHRRKSHAAPGLQHTPHPANKSPTAAVPARPTIRAPVPPPASVCEIRHQQEETPKTRLAFTIAPPPHYNPARRVMNRRKRRGQAETRGHAGCQRHLSTLSLIRPHLA